MGRKRTAATVVSDTDDDALFTEISTSYETGGNVNRECDKDHTSDDDYGSLTSSSFTENDHSSDEDYDCKGNTHHSQSNKEKGKVTDNEMEKHTETKWKRLHKENVSVGGGVVLCCHWCRQQSERPHVRCSQCMIKFCPSCLKNRNGENIEEEMQVRWVCPKCRGGCGRGCKNCCNCGPCRKTQRLPPTGPLARTAREAGFGSVHDYLISLKTKESAKVIARRKEGRGWTFATGAVIAYSDILRVPSWGKKGKRKWKKHRRSFPSTPCEESEQDVIQGKKYRRDYKKRILAFPSSSCQRDVTSIDTAGTSIRSIPSRIESEEQDSCTIHDRPVESGSEETRRYQKMVISLDAMNLSSTNGDQTGSPASVILESRKTGLLPKHCVVPKRKRSARKCTSRRREHDLTLDKSASTREELDHGLEQNTSRLEELDSKVDKRESIREELNPKVDQSKSSSFLDVHWSMKLLSYTEEELVSEVVQSESIREELNLQVHQSKSRREELDPKVDQRESIREELDLQVDQCTSGREELDPKVDQSKCRREELVSEVVQSESKREELNLQVDHYTSRREELNPEVNQSTSRREELDPKEVDQSTSRREELDPGVDQSKPRREALDLQVDQCKSRREELDHKVDQSKSRREELVSEVVESESIREELVRQVDYCTSRREEVDPEVDQSTSRREEVDAEVDERTSRREEVDPTVNQITSTRKELDPKVGHSTSRSEELDPKVDQSTSRREELDPKINQRRPRRQELDPKVCQITWTREDHDPKVDGEKREEVQLSPPLESAERTQLELPDTNTTAPRNDDHSDTSSQEEDIADVTLCNETERQVPPSAESAGTSQTSDSFQKRLDLLLQRPFLTEQLKRMWSHFNLHFVDISDFTEKIARTYTPGGKLKLLRGFFFWLKHSSMEGSFQPWAPENTEDNQTEDCAPLSSSDSQVIDELLSIGANISSSKKRRGNEAINGGGNKITVVLTLGISSRSEYRNEFQTVDVEDQQQLE